MRILLIVIFALAACGNGSAVPTPGNTGPLQLTEWQIIRRYVILPIGVIPVPAFDHTDTRRDDLLDVRLQPHRSNQRKRAKLRARKTLRKERRRGQKHSALGHNVINNGDPLWGCEKRF